MCSRPQAVQFPGRLLGQVSVAVVDLRVAGATDERLSVKRIHGLDCISVPLSPPIPCCIDSKQSLRLPPRPSRGLPWRTSLHPVGCPMTNWPKPGASIKRLALRLSGDTGGPSRRGMMGPSGYLFPRNGLIQSVPRTVPETVPPTVLRTFPVQSALWRANWAFSGPICGRRGSN